MPQESKALKGYVKTSNMYLTVFLAISIGFLGGVLFSAYRAPAVNPSPSGIQGPGTSAKVPPLSNEQAQTQSALIEATRVTPNNAKAWTQLGNFYFDAGKHNEAITAYEKALALEAEHPDVWTDMGVMYRRSGNPKKAIESFDQALSVNSRHEVAMFNKGVVYMHDLNDTKAAINAWEMLVKLNPDAKAPNGQLVKTLVGELKKKNQS